MMTYARSRLWLGITGVGLTVILAFVTIATNWPSRFLPSNPAIPFFVHLAHVAAVFGAQLLLFFPLDAVGGLGAVREKPPVGRWLSQWFRGAFTMFVVAVLAAAVMLGVGRTAENGAVVVAAVAFGAVLLGVNGALARTAASLATSPVTEDVRRAALRAGVDATRIRLVETDEAAFTGGWLGLLGQTLWLPKRWAEGLAPDELAAQLARRAAVRNGRWKGIALALGWNAFGLAVALNAPGGGAASAAGLITSSAWFTLWQFAGLLLLPSLSRPAVLEADSVAAVRVGADATYRALAKLDEWQEGESSRPEAVETVFHPVPQLRDRIVRLQQGGAAAPAGLGFYHATRTMLATGWAFSGQLGRAVHCNLGRPALWVVFPSD